MTTWVRQCGELWKTKTGCSPNWKRLAGELGRIKRETGAPTQTIVRHFMEYLYRTPTGYLSPTRFRETFKYWSPADRYRSDVDKRLDAEIKARERDIEPRQGGLERAQFN